MESIPDRRRRQADALGLLALHRSARRSIKRIEDLRESVGGAPDAGLAQRFGALEEEFLRLADHCAASALKTSYRFIWLSVGLGAAFGVLILQAIQSLVS